MRISDEIRIIDLLAQRDAEFLKVKACEDAIYDILGKGSPFVFEAPPSALPSAGRSHPRKFWKPVGLALPSEPDKKKNAAGGNKGRADGAERLRGCNFPSAAVDDELRQKLRPLKPETENAYRITYRDNGELKVSFHNNTEMLLAITTMRCKGFEVVSVESVWYTGPGEALVREVLWRSSNAPLFPEL